jgi:ABC-type Fe3+ transport system substrate-binding protein
MFTLMRGGKVDISFLTLFFIKMQGEKSSKIIQPINTQSPRLGNYKYLLPELTRIPMGMLGAQVLYIPFAGGSYGFYVNRKTVSAAEVPHSWRDIFDARWKGKYSLNKTQIWYNVAIASMAIGKKPFYLNDLAIAGDRSSVLAETRDGGPLAEKLKALYSGAGDFWDAAPTFPKKLDIVSSWGIEVKQANREGGDWRTIEFKEGDLVWMDTMNFLAGLSGRKLEAAEIVANYFIGREVQSRVSSELSLVAVSKLAATNPILKADPKFFTAGYFVPPYNTVADNVMTRMSDKALERVQIIK